MTFALLAGSSFSALPILEALQALDIRVAVAGNLPDDPCHGKAEKSVFIDYSDKDALLAAARNLGCDYILPSCNDESYIACAHAARTLGLPGYDSAENTAFINTKSIYRAFLADHDFPIPYAGENPKFPVLVKPVDSSGGKGVTKVMDASGLPAALAIAQHKSPSASAIVEEFFDGTLHSHSAFIKDGKIHIDFFADEFCTVYPYQVNCSNHPSRLDEALRQDMRTAMERLCSLRGLADGLLHTQFMTDGRNIRIIESMRRHPGDLYGRLIEYSTGFDYTAHFIAPFIGEPYPKKTILDAKPTGRHTISTDAPKLATDISVDLNRPVRFIPLHAMGQRLDPSPYGKFGLLFVSYANADEMLSITPRLAEYITIHGERLFQ